MGVLVDKVVVGDLETNCYIVINQNKCLIIDPGAEAKKIIDYIEKNELVPVGYLITHSHFDHIDAIPEIINKYKINEYQSDDLFNFEIIKTPGHLNDSVSFYFEQDKLLFSGDTLFKGTIGRFDLEGANRQDLFNSLDKLALLPDDVIVYPGHGPETTIKIEKKENIWLQ